MLTLFLSIPVVSGLSIMGFGWKLERQGRTTVGLLTAFLGLAILYACYGYASHWSGGLPA